jgi:Flp pilus assembly protein TadG
MIRKVKRYLHRFWHQTNGVVAVELAIVGAVLLLLISGALDFGHAWYMRQVVTNASREGARYGITYKTDSSGTRIAPNALSPSITQYILNNYLSSTALPSDANPNITLGGAGYATGTKGSPLEVTVTATKTWYLLSGLVPGLGDQKIITAKTVMLCE